jgi:hypothetical protein
VRTRAHLALLVLFFAQVASATVADEAQADCGAPGDAPGAWTAPAADGRPLGATPISCIGTLTADDTADAYTFHANAGESVRLWIETPTGQPASVHAYDPASIAIFEEQDGVTGGYRFVARETGSHGVVVAWGTGDYRLRIEARAPGEVEQAQTGVLLATTRYVNWWGGSAVPAEIDGAWIELDTRAEGFEQARVALARPIFEPLAGQPAAGSVAGDPFSLSFYAEEPRALGAVLTDAHLGTCRHEGPEELCVVPEGSAWALVWTERLGAPVEMEYAFGYVHG